MLLPRFSTVQKTLRKWFQHSQRSLRHLLQQPSASAEDGAPRAPSQDIPHFFVATETNRPSGHLYFLRSVELWRIGLWIQRNTVNTVYPKTNEVLAHLSRLDVKSEDQLICADRSWIRLWRRRRRSLRSDLPCRSE